MSKQTQECATGKAKLVLLLRDLWDMDNPLALRKIVWRKFHKKLPIFSGEDDAAEFIAVASPNIYIQFDGFLFHIRAVAEPFFADRNAVAAEMGELRLRQAVLDHQAYISVDLLTLPEDTDLDVASCMIGQMTSALGWSPTTLAVVSPLLEGARVWDKNIREALRSEDPVTALTQTPTSKVPVVPGDADDAGLQAATVEARRRWPQFVNAYADKHPDQIFAVKAPFTDAPFTEYMWIKVLKIGDEFLQGVIDNDPINLKKYKRGMRVRLRIKALTDWLYTDGDRLVGGFTNEALDEKRREAADPSRARSTAE